MDSPFRNYHSLKAYHDNELFLESNIDKAIALIRRSKSGGLTAPEFAKLADLKEHKNASSALSGAKKRIDSIILEKQKGKKNGRYIETDRFMWFYVKP
jgi:hypothetical protein